MAFNVRIFGHRGVAQLRTDMPLQFAADSVQVLVQPYEWSQLLVVADAAAVESQAVANDISRLIYVEVPDGKTVHYELKPPGRAAVAASPGSPSLAGKDQFEWGLGWTISFIAPPGGGGGELPPGGDPSLDFSDPDNSQYAPMI